jgi:hypothetical protein
VIRSGLSLRRNQTKLRQHSEGIEDTPVCGDLAFIVEAKDVSAIDFESLLSKTRPEPADGC